MSDADILGANCVDTEHLPNKRRAMSDDEHDILKRMIIGPPLNAQRSCIEEMDRLLTRYLSAVPQVLRQTYGEETEATQEAIQDCSSIANLPASADGVCCKRAALLFALRREPELKEYFKRRDSGFTNDLVDRILPFVDPRFLSHSCQAPDSYVFMVVMLSQMFEGERLGNWPWHPPLQSVQANVQESGEASSSSSNVPPPSH